MAMYRVTLTTGMISKQYHISISPMYLDERIERLIEHVSDIHNIEYYLKSKEMLVCAHCGHAEHHDNGSFRIGCFHEDCECRAFEIPAQIKHCVKDVDYIHAGEAEFNNCHFCNPVRA